MRADLPVQQTLPGLDSPLTGDVSNDRNTMLHSFFALEAKRTDPIQYRSGGVEIIVQGTKSGIATINDKELLVYICSIASQKLARGEPVSQKFRFTAHDFFSVTGKTPGGKNISLFFISLGTPPGHPDQDKYRHWRPERTHLVLLAKVSAYGDSYLEQRSGGYEGD
jgi:hypothetical protein